MQPSLVAFDLDGTFWENRGGRYRLRPDIERILQDVVRRGLEIAIASNHNDKDEAETFFETERVEIEGRSRRLMDLVTHKCFIIEPGSKIAHFEKIHRNSSIAYCEMLFFDDLEKHSNVEEKGVTFIQVDGDDGLDWATYKRGLARISKAILNHYEDGNGDWATYVSYAV
ncbi:acid phosphatase-domain-containing protein, partial [Mycena pura]